jgi:hypothetical protein
MPKKLKSLTTYIIANNSDGRKVTIGDKGESLFYRITDRACVYKEACNNPML